MKNIPEHSALKSGHVYIDWLFNIEPESLTKDQVKQIDILTRQTNDLWDQKIFATKSQYNFEYDTVTKPDDPCAVFNAALDAGKKFVADYHKLDNKQVTAGLAAQFDLIQTRMQAALDRLR